MKRAERLCAYLVDGCGDEAGRSCMDAVVVDLVSARGVDAVHWSDDGAWRTDAVVEPHEHFAERVHAMLAKHGIDPDDAAARGRFVAGDRFDAEQRFRIALSSKPLRDDDDGVTREHVVRRLHRRARPHDRDRCRP